MATNDQNKKLKVVPSKDSDECRYYHPNFALTMANEKDKYTLSNPGDVLTGFERNNGTIATHLCRNLLEIPGVRSLIISRYQLTVNIFVSEEWGEMGDGLLSDQVDTVIMKHFPDATITHELKP